MRLISKGFGESQPLVDPRSAEAEARNRRVEFSVVEAVARPEGARQFSLAEQVRWREGRPQATAVVEAGEEKTDTKSPELPGHTAVHASEGAPVEGAAAPVEVVPEAESEVAAPAPAPVEPAPQKSRKKVRRSPDSVDHH